MMRASRTDPIGGIALAGKIVIDDKVRRCIECNQPLVKNKEGTWSCPSNCGTWSPNTDKIQEQMKFMVKYIGSSLHKDPLPAGGASPGRSSSKSGRKRKKPLKKVKSWELT